MKKVLTICAVVMAAAAPVWAGNTFDGQMDYERTDWGWYAALTGGLFPNGQTYNGTDASGGTMRYIHDDSAHPWGHPEAFQAWGRDGWFVETSSVALTMKRSGSIAFDNNAIETGAYPTNFYGNSSDPTEITPGLYLSYNMSNNIDWVYSGYFKLTEATEVDQIIGYFAETYSYPIDLSKPFTFNTNIYSAVEGTGDHAGHLMPANTGAFRGDVFSSDNVSGTHSFSDTGVVRHYSAFSNNDDIIYRLTYTLDQPLTLPAGEYFFSHDAMIPEPATMALFGLGGLSLLRRKKSA